MKRLGDYAIGYQGSDDQFENYIDEYPIATKREIWDQARQEAAREILEWAAGPESYDEWVVMVRERFGLEG